MKKQLIGIFGFLFVLYLSSCVSHEVKKEFTIQSISKEIDEAVISTSEIIINKLPAKSIIALFNIAVDENELTNFVIEEISSILVNRGGFKIVERDKIENIENEHNWQMNTGYVPDDQITSIVEKLGAEYVVSCYISGNGDLQRLRIKTWKIKTGETITSNVYPVGNLGNQLVKSTRNYNEIVNTIPNVELITDKYTIKDNGITIDYYLDNNEDAKLRSLSIQFEIYIDGTMYYFIADSNISIWNKEWLNETDKFSLFIGEDFNYECLLSFNFPDFEKKLSAYFFSKGINLREANSISRVMIGKVFEIGKKYDYL